MELEFLEDLGRWRGDKDDVSLKRNVKVTKGHRKSEGGNGVRADNRKNEEIPSVVGCTGKK